MSKLGLLPKGFRDLLVFASKISGKRMVASVWTKGPEVTGRDQHEICLQIEQIDSTGKTLNVRYTNAVAGTGSETQQVHQRVLKDLVAQAMVDLFLRGLLHKANQDATPPAHE